MDKAIDTTAKALASLSHHVGSAKDQGPSKGFQTLIKMIGEAKTKHVSVGADVEGGYGIGGCGFLCRRKTGSFEGSLTFSRTELERLMSLLYVATPPCMPDLWVSVVSCSRSVCISGIMWCHVVSCGVHVASDA